MSGRARGLRAALLGAALVAAASPAAGFERSLALLPEDRVLDGGAFEEVLTLHLPAAEPVMKAVLNIAFDNALATAPDGSRLMLTLNDRELARLPAAASQGRLDVEVEIPGHLLAPGTNRLAIRGELRHRLACTRAAASELWFRLLADGTRLRLGTVGTGSPKAEDAASLLAASFFDGEPLGIVSARPVGDTSLLGWGARVAEAVAGLRAPRPLVVEDVRIGGEAVDLTALRGRNLVAVGTGSELRPLLEATGIGTAGPVTVARLPHDPTHVAVILSGVDDRAVDNAVGLMADAAARARAMAGSMPDQTSSGRARSVSLRELGYRTRETPITFTGRDEVELVLPATLYAGDGQTLDLQMSYAYAAGLAPTSSLLILVNGAPWNMLRLDRPDGALVDRQRVSLPLGLFRPGRNRIGFQPVLEPLPGVPCPATGSPAFSLFEDSEIRLPATAQLGLQPDLGRFADSGMPFAAENAGAAEVVVTSQDEETIGAAWTLLGKLAQQRGRGLGEAALGFAPTSPDRNLLVIGPVDRLPPPLRQPTQAAAARLGARPLGAAAAAPAATFESAAPEPAFTDRTRDAWEGRLGGRAEPEGFGAWLDAILGMAHATAVPGPAAGPVAHDDGGPRDAAIVGFRSPLRERKTVVAVMAASPASLGEAVATLVATPAWSGIEGGAVYWNRDGSGLVSMAPKETYRVGPLPTEPRELLLVARTFLARHTLWWLATAGLVLLLLGLATRHALAKRVDSRL